MRVHCVVIPCHASEAAKRELNGFLGGNRIIAVDRQLVIDGQQSFWAICVSYVESAQRALPQSDQRIDYRQVLPAGEFQVFSKLRELRKALAEKEGVPPYGVFTNEQLAEMVRKRIQDVASLGAIAGVGPARVAKYGAAVLELLAKECATLPPAGAAAPEKKDHGESKPDRSG